MRLLLDHGADTSTQNKYRWTVLHQAVFKGCFHIVDFLLKRGAHPHSRTDQGKTPFQLASERDYLQTMQLLSEWTGECVEDSEMRDQPRRCGFGRGHTTKLCGKQIYYPIASC